MGIIVPNPGNISEIINKFDSLIDIFKNLLNETLDIPKTPQKRKTPPQKGIFGTTQFQKEEELRKRIENVKSERWAQVISPLMAEIDLDLTPYREYFRSAGYKALSHFDVNELSVVLFACYCPESFGKTITESAEVDRMIGTVVHDLKRLERIREEELKAKPDSEVGRQSDSQKPTETVEDKTLSSAEEKAYRSYEYAINTWPDLAGKTDRSAYVRLSEDGIDDYDLPSFETWWRYVRAGRKLNGTCKNTLRTGREVKSPKANDDPDLIKQISNQYTKPD